jgi:ribosomal protein S17
MKYGKHMAVRRTTRFMAHDEDQICEPGDVVEIRSVFFLQP